MFPFSQEMITFIPIPILNVLAGIQSCKALNVSPIRKHTFTSEDTEMENKQTTAAQKADH